MLREAATHSSTPPEGRSTAPVPIESRALGTLSYIRASIDAAGSLAVPGMAGIVMGGIGMLAAGLAATPSLGAYWLLIWLAAALLAFALGGTLMARQAARHGHTRQFAPFRKFLLCLCPALFAGAALTLVLWQAGMERLIPGTWLLLYGCAVMAASTVTGMLNMRLIGCMGAVFILLGLVSFAAPARVHTLILGLGFGALHLIFGILIRQRHGE